MTEGPFPFPLQEGTLFVYPPTGLVRLEALAPLATMPNGGLFLHLAPQLGDNPSQLMIPLATATRSGLRPLSDPALIPVCYGIIRQQKWGLPHFGKKSADCPQLWQARLGTGDILDQARLVRDFRRVAGEPGLTAAESNLVAQAALRLTAEIAAIKQIDRRRIGDEIAYLLTLPTVKAAPTDDYTPVKLTRRPAAFNTTTPHNRIEPLPRDELIRYRRNQHPIAVSRHRKAAP